MDWKPTILVSKPSAGQSRPSPDYHELPSPDLPSPIPRPRARTTRQQADVYEVIIASEILRYSDETRLTYGAEFC